MIKVLLVDDDALCCDGLSLILSLAGDIQVVGVASSSEEAFRVGRETRPDVVVIDADLPGEQCLEAMRRLAGLSGQFDQPPSFVCLAVYPDQRGTLPAQGWVTPGIGRCDPRGGRGC